MNPESPASTFRPDLFHGHRVLVVGGTSGIGHGIATAFARHGAEVCATGATEAEVAAAREQASPTLQFRALDVRDSAAVAAQVGEFPEIDVLVNCAGIIRRGDEHDPAVFAAVIDINLTGMMRTCAAARPALAHRRGCIINTASLLTFTGGALIPAYAASKGGVGQLTKSLALAYAGEGIRVNALAPGYIVTPLTDALRADPARHAAICARTALHRWGTTAEVADAALFLASPAARYVTGTILPVDGGYLAS